MAAQCFTSGISTSGVPLFNAYLLSNLWEYHHESHNEKKLILWPTFSLQTGWFNLSWCDVIGPKATKYEPCLCGLTQYMAGLSGCLCMALGSIPRAGRATWVKILLAYAL